MDVIFRTGPLTGFAELDQFADGAGGQAESLIGGAIV